MRELAYVEICVIHIHDFALDEFKFYLRAFQCNFDLLFARMFFYIQSDFGAGLAFDDVCDFVRRPTFDIHAINLENYVSDLQISGFRR